jgi:hypothetical protein
VKPPLVATEVKQKKKTVRENDSTNEVFNQNVLFVHMSDVDEGVKELIFYMFCGSGCATPRPPLLERSQPGTLQIRSQKDPTTVPT